MASSVSDPLHQHQPSDESIRATIDAAIGVTGLLPVAPLIQLVAAYAAPFVTTRKPGTSCVIIGTVAHCILLDSTGTATAGSDADTCLLITLPRDPAFYKFWTHSGTFVCHSQLPNTRRNLKTNLTDSWDGWDGFRKICSILWFRAVRSCYGQSIYGHV